MPNYLGPNLSARVGGRDSELDACLHSSVGVKGTESGGKGRSIRRHFTPGHYFLRLVA